MPSEKLSLHTCERLPLRFWLRDGTSDVKAVREVIEQNSYQKPRKGFIVAPGERWVDLGANVGAFSLLAAHLGAEHVDAYEADPDSFEVLCRNIQENDFEKIITPHELAVVGDQQKKAWLSVSEKNKNFWRNSIVKQWKGSRMVQVPCINFERVLADAGSCVKMDIEGAEMPILEKLSHGHEKLVFEWSFDIDKDCDRFRAAMAHLAQFFGDMDYRPIPPEVREWPGSWFPAAMTVFCRRSASPFQTRRGVSSETT